MTKIDELKKAYGTTKFDGREYTLTQQAYIEYDSRTGMDHYIANAICEDDKQDEYSTIPSYQIIWEIPEATLEYWADGGDDEGSACDWDNPDEVRQIGGYCLDDGTIC